MMMNEPGQHLASASDESRTILSSISDMALFNNNWDLRKDEEQVNINIYQHQLSTATGKFVPNSP